MREWMIVFVVPAVTFVCWLLSHVKGTCWVRHPYVQTGVETYWLDLDKGWFVPCELRRCKECGWTLPTHAITYESDPTRTWSERNFLVDYGDPSRSYAAGHSPHGLAPWEHA